jgi:DNA invertase Pin-like site-specific DNA recombinase
MIGERTKAALQAAKARGVRLGRNAAEQLAPASRQAAIDRAVELAPLFSELWAAGLSARAMAAELVARGVPTPTGAKWHAQTVLRAMGRMDRE